jgi:hypothetical protein
MVQSFVGRVFSSGRRVNPPLCLYIDECQNVLYYGIEDLFAKAGGPTCGSTASPSPFLSSMP